VREEADFAAGIHAGVLVKDDAGGIKVMQGGDQPEGDTQEERQGDEGEGYWLPGEERGGGICPGRQGIKSEARMDCLRQVGPSRGG
jgi:hypothetical protein